MTNAYGTSDEARAAVRQAADNFKDAAGEVSETRRAAKNARKSAVAASGALAEAASSFARDARSIMEEKAAKARTEAERQYGRLKVQAKQRATEADVFVHERPYVALGAAALAGFLIGQMISASRSSYVVLREDR